MIRTRKNPPVAARIFGTAALAVTAFSLSSCTSSDISAPGPLVPASDAQFTGPLSVKVTDGTSGQERTPDNASLWWLTAAGGDITVSNLASDATTVVVSALVQTPPCADAADIELAPAGGSTTHLHAGPAGGSLSVPVEVPRGQSTTIRIAVVTPGCTIPGDPRTFFAGLVGLKASP